MNKSQRIYLNTGDTGNQNQDKFIKVKLEQNVETLEFMSLSISTADAYQNFNADYGVLVGRVIANNGIGIPNAKISIFIPLSDEDANNSDIYSVYPYKTPRDENNEGKRYNLLPRVSKKDSDTGVVSPKQPFGSFPIKEEVVGNQPFLDTYKKYYKYTALTNTTGDYMIFGIPVGTQVVHLSLDITDIGEYSMTPAAMVNSLGYSPNLFSEDKTKIKPSDDLNDLPNIETQEITVDIVPFWGDVENFEIGITRQDFRVRAKLINTFVIFGTAFSDGDNTMWAHNHKDDEENNEYARKFYRIRPDTNHIGISTKRTGIITEKIYCYPNKYSDDDIDMGIYGPEDMELLDPNEYISYKKNGDFVYIINANRNKIIKDESGEEVLVSDNYAGGVYKNFRGFVVFEISNDELPLNFRGKIGKKVGDTFYAYPFRYKLKFPQKSPNSKSFNYQDTTRTNNWRREDYNFEADNIYSISKFHGIVYNDNDDNGDFSLQSTGFVSPDTINNGTLDPNWNTGIIGTNYTDDDLEYQMPSNTHRNDLDFFGANWLNLCIHFPQVGYLDEDWGEFGNMRSTTNFSANPKRNHFYEDNEQLIAADDVNTKHFARSDLHHTDFIKINKSTILLIDEVNKKGFTIEDDEITPTLENKIRNGDFRNGDYTCPYNGGKNDGKPNNSIDDNYYFYKGLNESDCIKYVISLGLV